jgi:predicted aspartyl protease
MRIHRVVIITVAMLVANFAQGESPPGEIPFKLAQGFGIVVRGGIGPLTNLNFLVDTGAVPSVLSERVASRIGFTGVPGSFALLNKNMQAQYVTVDEVRLGPIRALYQSMAVVDLARFERLLGTRIDAIVGLDILARQSLSIDYKHGKITLGLSGLARHVLPVEIYALSGAPYWILPITLGGHSFRVLLDTGANELALFAGHIPNLDGEEAAARPLRLFMGGVAVNKPSAVVLDEPPSAFQNIDGVLGPTALRMSRVEFDLEHKCLRWDTE